MYQLLTGSFPFWDSVQNISLQQVWQAILVKKIDLDSKKLKDSITDDARDLLKRLLRRDPAKRMTALQALDHPWVKEGGSASESNLAGSVVSSSAKQPLNQADLLLCVGASVSGIANAVGNVKCCGKLDHLGRD